MILPSGTSLEIEGPFDEAFVRACYAKAIGQPTGIEWHLPQLMKANQLVTENPALKADVLDYVRRHSRSLTADVVRVG